MSMLAGATLLASTLLGAAPAQSADVPAEFGTDWDDPRTAAPPVEKPAESRARVTLAEAQFRDFTPYKGTYTPPEGCGDRGARWCCAWTARSRACSSTGSAICTSAGSRSSYVHPEPSPDGIEWAVEKDVTATAPRSAAARTSDAHRERRRRHVHRRARRQGHADLLPGAGRASGGHRDRRTGVQPAPDGSALTTPRNRERIVAEVYATGSGGGCEEFWYMAVPGSAPYSCRADGGPYREVQFKVRRPAGRHRHAVPACVDRGLVQPLPLVRRSGPARLRRPADRIRPRRPSPAC